MFGLANTLFSRHKKPGRKSTFKPQFETLEKREVMSGFSALSGVVATTSWTLGGAFLPPQPTAAGLALFNSLPDTPVRTTALADYQRDGGISRNDMIDIFQNGTTGFTDLTNDELSSLQTLVKNGSTVAMPDYVQNLASKVLAGVPAGGLSPAQSLQQNVDNFFLGLKRPQDFPNAAYAPVNLPLFHAWDGGSWAPSPTDVNQIAYWKDNWLLTGLEEVASRNVNDIWTMFIDNGDSSYTVRFYHGSAADYVTVDNYFPSSDGALGLDAKVLWVPLAIKAYAQENAAGWLGAPQPGVNSYAALMAPTNGGNPGWVFSAITGLSSSSSTNMNASSIVTAWSQGHLVAMKTLDNSQLVGTTGADPTFYPECHGDSNCGGYLPPPRWYALVGYNAHDPAFGGDPSFTLTEDGKRLILMDTSVLGDNFDTWVHTTGAATPTSARVASAPGNTITVTGFVQSGTLTLTTRPAVVSQHHTQAIHHHKGPNTFTVHSKLHLNKTVLAPLSAAKKGAVNPVLLLSDGVVNDLFAGVGSISGLPVVV
jgi:hypothetical protein